MSGKPSRYNPETLRKIEQAIRLGASRRLAAAYGGIDEDTLIRWRKKHSDVAEMLTRAEGGGAMQWLSVIEEAATTDWRAAAWKLERRFPQEYGKSVVEQQGRDGAPIQHHIEGQLDHSGGITVRAIDYREAIRPLLPLGGAPALDDKDAQEE